MKRRWLALVLALAFLLACTAFSAADAGGFSGDSDWGSWDSGSDWSSDSDWGSDSDWNSDSDWGSNSGSGWGGGNIFFFNSGDDTSSSGTTGGSGGSYTWIIGLIVIVVVILLISRSRKKNLNDPTQAPIPQACDLSALQAKDPNFSADAFLEKAGNIYIEMQTAWQNKDWEPMRAYLSDALYSQMEKQLAQLIQNKQTNKMERIAVLNRVITRYTQDDTNDILTCYLQVRFVDYTVSDETGAVVSGSQTKEKFIAYEWSFTRSKDVKTPVAGDGTTQHNCKKCGAPLSINQTARCEYCGAVITATEHDWVLTNIRGLWQRTL